MTADYTFPLPLLPPPIQPPSSAAQGLTEGQRCAQLFLYSTGGHSQPKSTVSIPGYVNSHDPGVLYDYWKNPKPTNYQPPGPDPYVKLNSGGGAPIKVPFKPHNFGACLVKNANWCGVRPKPEHYSSKGECFEVRCSFGHAKWVWD